MKMYFTFLSIACVICATSATDYCRKSCPTEKHIGCNPQTNFGPSCPSDARMINMGQSEKQLIVGLHNEKRNFIAGGGHPKHKSACRMATMKWDDELALLASYKVRHCDFEHDHCHNTDRFEYSGQNIAMSASTANNIDTAKEITNAVELWYNEISGSDQSAIDKLTYSKISGILHFTEMMGEDNTHVGCAGATYTKNTHFGKALNFIFYCNYATINMLDSPVYTKCVQPASKCERRSAQYPNLCA